MSQPSHVIPADPPRRIPGSGFWRKTWAVLVKEFIQLKRDRVSFAMIIMIPLIQLLLFGYAINTTPRDLPTAVLLQESSDLSRSILAALKNTRYFKITQLPRNEAELDRLLASGQVLFAVEIPANFERAVRRGESPAMLVAADATDPVASGSALSALGQVVQTALAHDRDIPAVGQMPFQIRVHPRYNPAGVTQLNIVPGLVGTILTMTMLIFTALSVTREIERGTMENLLSMPISPVEIMLGKIIPYILVGFVQAAMIIAIGVLLFGVPLIGSLALLAALSVTREIERGTMENLLSMPISPTEIMLGKIIPYILVGFVQAAMIIAIGVFLFGVPLIGNLALLAALSTLFIAANLSIGYTFSTIAQNQLQAMQMTIMFFLPNILLSGFLFPFAGMPRWAQWVGEALPLTHYLRITRAVMLKGASIGDLQHDAIALTVLMLVAMTIAVTRFRRTLD